MRDDKEVKEHVWCPKIGAHIPRKQVARHMCLVHGVPTNGVRQVYGGTFGGGRWKV